MEEVVGSIPTRSTIFSTACGYLAVFEPKYEECQPRTIWSLSNAFTSAFKELDPHPAIQRWRGSGVLGNPVLTVVLAAGLGGPPPPPPQRCPSLRPLSRSA